MSNQRTVLELMTRTLASSVPAVVYQQPVWESQNELGDLVAALHRMGLLIVRFTLTPPTGSLEKLFYSPGNAIRPEHWTALPWNVNCKPSLYLLKTIQDFSIQDHLIPDEERYTGVVFLLYGALSALIDGDLVATNYLGYMLGCLRETAHRIIFIESDAEKAPDFGPLLPRFFYAPPEGTALSGLLDQLTKTSVKNLEGRRNRSTATIPTDLINDTVLQASLGLTRAEIATVFGQLITQYRTEGLAFTRSRLLDEIRKAKISKLAKAGLQLIDYQAEPVEFAGYARLRLYCEREAAGFTPEAQSLGIDKPRGIMLVGPPGTGKTLVTRWIGQTWGLPVVVFNPGDFMSSRLGSTEGNLSQALRTLDTVGPCILQIDEIDKNLAGMQSSADAGVGSRMLAKILSWMSDHTSPVFVVATANDPSGLPPELMRPGRFDQRFFVGPPCTEDREAICRLYLSKVKVRIEPKVKDSSGVMSTNTLSDLVDMTAWYTAAEIKAVIQYMAKQAFAQGTPATFSSVLIREAVAHIRPLLLANNAEVEHLMKWSQSLLSAGELPEKSLSLSFE